MTNRSHYSQPFKLVLIGTNRERSSSASQWAETVL